MRERKFLGVIRYADDTAGIVEGGLAAGVLITIMAITGLIGIVFAWLICCFVGSRKAHSTRS